MLTNLRRGRNYRRNWSDDAAQLGTQLFPDETGVHAVANDLRPNEDDQLGAGVRFALVREGVTQFGNLVEYRNAAAGEILLLLNQTRQQYRLAARDRDRALDLSLREGRIPADARSVLNLADLLLDIEPHIAVDADARHQAQDEAYVAIVDGVDDCVVGRKHGRGAGRDRHIATDHQGRHLVVDHHQRRIRQHLGGGHGVQRVENHVWP